MKLRITVQGKQYDVDVEVLDEGGAAPVATAPVAATAPAPAAAAPAPAPVPAPTGGGAGEATAPIAGNVLDVKVKVGDTVGVNDPLIILEAMKMESVVASPQAGTVASIAVSSGDAVQAGQVLVTFS
ncbi:biotin/lipoyl-containing protein [Poriferisphaera sp. WC338]|uniref:biotin/lipoyl-containing protein n=1 Tax=Poriferisphaera sp. WC338 TaxID=3425129 RepID=UPI003D81424B